MDAAEAWCALPDNSGWIFKGKHKEEGDKSEFEVVLRNSVPVPPQDETTEPTAEATTPNQTTDKEAGVEEEKA